ncbi:MAG: hypothetical protein RLZZ533_446 [Cyanobacteriota bacterium]|jgi:hypothetical protein
MEALKPLFILLLAAPIWIILHAIATAHNLGAVTLGVGLAGLLTLLPIRKRRTQWNKPNPGEREHRCRPSRSQHQSIGMDDNQGKT